MASNSLKYILSFCKYSFTKHNRTAYIDNVDIFLYYVYDYIIWQHTRRPANLNTRPIKTNSFHIRS